jgi:hypothetical protein
MAETFFQLPTDPEEFGVVLDPPNLRRIDFSALEFQEMRNAIIEYMKTYFSDIFNDFVANNGVIMFAELVSYLADVLSNRSDIIADEAFLPTAQTEEAVDQHLFLINNKIKRPTPAVVDIEISIPTEAPTSINIPPGLQFNITGADGNSLTYELYRAPGDFNSNVTIFPGSRGIIGFGLEGSFGTPIVAESAGGPNQSIEILDSSVLDEPIIVSIATGNVSEDWTRIDTLERAGANDKVFEVIFSEDKATVRFGNDIAGRAILAGQVITVRFRTGGGIRGRISSNVINETRPITPEAPASAPVNVLFRNPNSSNGGTNKETIQEAKVRAPKESAALGSATSGEDYAVLSKNFSHPVFGAVLKSVATVKTSLNANIVNLHVLAAGPDDIPVLPSLGLKTALEQFFDEINVLTDEVRVVDAAIKPVALRANIVISRTFDPSVLRDRIDSTITNFFDQSNFELGQPLYLSQICNLLQSIDGVQFIQIREPVDDIIRSSEGAVTAADNQVGFDELITLGDLQIKIFADKVTF